MTTNKESRSGPGRPSTFQDPVRTICDAAASLFAAKGYDNTSLQDVATSIGVTKAGLYHYFPTKQALFETIVLGTLSEMYDEAETAIASVSDHREKLVSFMSAHARYFETHMDRYRASFFGQAGSSEGFTPEQLASRKAYVALLERLLGDAVRDGALIIPDIPIFARGILGMLNWLARWYRPDGEKTATQIAIFYARTLLSGIDPR